MCRRYNLVVGYKIGANLSRQNQKAEHEEFDGNVCIVELKVDSAVLSFFNNMYEEYIFTDSEGRLCIFVHKGNVLQFPYKGRILVIKRVKNGRLMLQKKREEGVL